MEEQTYERTVTCELCGREFKVRSKYSRAKRCPGCMISIRYGRHVAEGEEMPTRKRRHVSQLDELAREAKEYGLSYGKYVALLRTGTQAARR